MQKTVLDTVSRPQNLPDFQNPPLNEVVLGVQFATPEGYQQIYAGEVWNLFRTDFPRVQEQPPLEPTFEVFGLPDEGARMARLNIITGASHDRFWFLNPIGDELIQFQQDRLLHNWRKVGDGLNSYPRFESIIENFRQQLVLLQDYFSSLIPQTLNINQCEVSYINHIAGETREELRVSKWIKFVNFQDKEPEDFSFGFREIIYDEADKKPRGRLNCQVSSAIKAGKPIIAMPITVRGTPKTGDIESAVQFIAEGRELIDNRFVELTTDLAHQKWGRTK